MSVQYRVICCSDGHDGNWYTTNLATAIDHCLELNKGGCLLCEEFKGRHVVQQSTWETIEFFVREVQQHRDQLLELLNELER